MFGFKKKIVSPDPPVVAQQQQEEDTDWLNNVPPEMLNSFMLQAAVHRAKSQRFEMSKEPVDELRDLPSSSTQLPTTTIRKVTEQPRKPLGTPLGIPLGIPLGTPLGVQQPSTIPGTVPKKTIGQSPIGSSLGISSAVPPSPLASSVPPDEVVVASPPITQKQSLVVAVNAPPKLVQQVPPFSPVAVEKKGPPRVSEAAMTQRVGISF
jgi:hypothetical protein